MKVNLNGKHIVVDDHDDNVDHSNNHQCDKGPSQTLGGAPAGAKGGLTVGVGRANEQRVCTTSTTNGRVNYSEWDGGTASNRTRETTKVDWGMGFSPMSLQSFFKGNRNKLARNRRIFVFQGNLQALLDVGPTDALTFDPIRFWNEHCYFEQVYVKRVLKVINRILARSAFCLALDEVEIDIIMT